MMADKLILGENCCYSMDSTQTGLNNNVVLVGGSGSGKTTSYVEYRLLETNERSLIVPITKRRILDKYRPFLEKKGYNVLELNFASPAHGDVCFDPMFYVHSDQDKSFLSRSIVMANPQKSQPNNADPYWDMCSTSLFSSLIGLAFLRHRHKTRFSDVLSLYRELRPDFDTTPVTTELDDVFERVTCESPESFTASCWMSFHSLPSKTAGSVLSTLNVTLDSLFTENLLLAMKTLPPVDILRASMEKTVLFIVTSPVNPAMNSLVSLFYSMAIKALFEYAESRPDGRLPLPVDILCDDFATGGRILNFAEYISIFREKGVSVSLLLQSESQLEAMYGNTNATTILNNCDSYVFFGGNDLLTAKNISYRLNAPLDEVLYMPIGKVIVFRRGQRPVMTSRYNILENPLYQKLTRSFEKRSQNKNILL